jgi:hypothetical protein
MLKISRIKLCEYNKSCRSFHNGFNKIGFAFFWFSYDFLRNLQESAKHMYYLRWCFAPGSLELFSNSQICPRFTLKTLERFQTSQLGPWTNGGGGLAGIRRLRRGFRPGKMWRRCRGSPWLDLRVVLGQGGRRRGRAAVQPGGVRLELSSGELSAGATTRAAVRSPVGPRGGSRAAVWHRARREDHPTWEWHERRRRTGRMQAGGASARGGGKTAFCSRCACLLVTGGLTVASRGARGRTTADGPRGTARCRTAARSVRRSRGAGHWEGTLRPWEGARRGRRSDKARGRDSAHDAAKLCHCVPVWTRKTLKSWIEVHKVVNRKVVELTTLYNFYKGRMVFFSTDFAQTTAKLWMPPHSDEQEMLTVDQVFHQFPLKIWNGNLHESCVPRQTGQLSFW